MRARIARGVALGALLSCAGASSDPGLKAWLRVANAQYVPDSMPEPQDGPAVASTYVTNNTVEVGQINLKVSGALEPAANAAAIGLWGDSGYWTVPAGIPDVQVPDLPTFEVRVSFARNTPVGSRDLIIRAVDRSGRFGAASSIPLQIEDATLPSGELVISLSWDLDADLDLHVVDPAGVEIWARNPSSTADLLPGQQPSGDSEGVLDFDSNAQCVIDGRRRENVVWKATPPAGRYIIRVDTFSLCQVPVADWLVEVYRSGQKIGTAHGTSTADATRLPHDAGAGVTALDLEIQ